MKTCKTCLVEKPKSEFYATQRQCKACALAEKKRLRDAHRARGMTADEQECKVCRETKAAAEFGINWARPTGLEVACRGCVKAREERGDRRCSSCRQVKPPTDFHKGGGRVTFECKQCHATRKMTAYRQREAAGVTVSSARCNECGETKPASAFRNNWHRSSGLHTKCHDCMGHVNREMTHRITREEHARMLAEQDGVCAICGQPDSSRTPRGNAKALAVDHNHATGQVRGLLCANCNKGIGNLGDDPHRLAAAIRYLAVNDATKRGALGLLVESYGSPN